MSDALIELTGALAGLTFALKDLNLVALAGLVTGIAYILAWVPQSIYLREPRKGKSLQ